MSYPRQWSQSILRSGTMLGTAALLIAVGLDASEAPDLSSRWRDREIVIDGKSSEWEGTFVAIEKPSVVIGMMNDAEFLYICLIPQSRDVRAQMLHSGFTLWFDPAGGKENVFGIGFPLGSGGRFGMAPPPDHRNAPESDKREQIVEEANSEMEIRVPALGEKHRIPVRVAVAIQVRISADEERLVYEAKIPLIRNADHPHAVGVAPGGFVGVQMETTEVRAGERPQHAPGSGPGGGGPGGGFMPPGGGGGFGPGGGGAGPVPGGARPSPPKPMKLHIRVKLAGVPPVEGL